MRYFSLLFLAVFLFADVKEEIIKFYKEHYPNINIESISSNKPFPKKYAKIDFKLANYKLPSSTIIIDGKYYFYKIKAKIGVYKATDIIKVNQLIKPNVTFEMVPFRSFYSTPLSTISDNLIASKIISKNAVINKSNTKIKPLILKDQTVSVIFSNDAIDVYSKGKALNDANANDTVKVRIKGNVYEGVADKKGEVIIK